MQFFAKKFLLVLCSLALLAASAGAQENKYSFTWLDKSERSMAGILYVALVPLAGEGLYEVDFNVTWNDQNGRLLTDAGQMPVLVLSKWDIDGIYPEKDFKCTSIDPKKTFNLVFRSAGKLNWVVLNGYTGEIRFTVHFRYALSQELYDSGKSEKIEIKGSNALPLDFIIKPTRSLTGIDIAGAGQQNPVPDKNNAIMRTIGANYQALNKMVAGLEDQHLITAANRQDYEQSLDQVTGRIENEKKLLNPDSLPSDSVQLYRGRYNMLNSQLLEIRLAYFRLRLSQTGKTADAGGALHSSDSLRKLIRIHYENGFRVQADSLTNLAQEQKRVAGEISVVLVDKRGSRVDPGKVDSLFAVHGTVKTAFNYLNKSHEDIWSRYRLDIDTLLPVREIESLHATYSADQKEVQSAIDQVDRVAASWQPDPEPAPWYTSNRLLWAGLLALLVFVFASLIWSSDRNRRIVKEQLSSYELGNGTNQAVKTGIPGIIPNTGPTEYYTSDYKDIMSDSVVGVIHYHLSAIKSVYHIIQGAQIERKGTEFGAYLFGNQYQLPGKGSVRTELFVEKICESRLLRSSIANDIAARADLVEELDALVLQNKKYRLIGWLTSSADQSMEIPEGLMKIHRSFFKEKWQIGILINPGSDVLQGAGFLRRKSGYLDPMPDPGAFLKWDEMYRYALNPPVPNAKETTADGIEAEDYSTIALNNTWGDSIVSSVNFDSQLVGEINSIAAHQAIPRDNYQIVGFLYGKVITSQPADGKPIEYEVYIDRFIELTNELTPRDLPGMLLIGWWGQSNVDVINYLQSAVDYHESQFREGYQIACLAKPVSGEFRVFSRKHSLEMNNSTIETEEYELKSLLSR